MPLLNTFTRSCIALAISHSLMQTASAASIVVDTLGDESLDDANCTLREAVVSANTNPGTMVSGCVSGTAGSDTITFDSNLAGESVNLNSQLSVNEALIINGLGEDLLTITGGGASRIISASNTELTLNDIKFSGGQASGNGGAIRAQNTTLIVSDCTFSGNTATGGGAISLATSSSATVSNSTFMENSASSGGALYTDQASLKVIGSTISNNAATDAGGGAIYAENDSYLSIESSTVAANSATGGGQGGAFYLGQNQIAKIENTTISANSATSSGGGLYTRNQAMVSISNSTVSGNSADSGGGFHAEGGSKLYLSNVTVAQNTATGGAGFNITDGSTLSLDNTLVSGNASSYQLGNEILASSGVTISSTNSLLGDSSQTSSVAFSNFTLSASDINATQTDDGVSTFLPTALADIIDGLADNGGSTQTHALVSNSPGVDAGNNTNCGTDGIIDTDQRGESRGDGSCDIGAFELIVEESDDGLIVIPANNGKVVIVPL